MRLPVRSPADAPDSFARLRGPPQRRLIDIAPGQVPPGHRRSWAAPAARLPVPRALPAGDWHRSGAGPSGNEGRETEGLVRELADTAESRDPGHPLPRRNHPIRRADWPAGLRPVLEVPRSIR